MHVPTGKIVTTNEAWDDYRAEDGRRHAVMEKQLVALSNREVEKLEPMTRHQRKGWMRNKKCVCGSGKKFKWCCWSKFS